MNYVFKFRSCQICIINYHICNIKYSSSECPAVKYGPKLHGNVVMSYFRNDVRLAENLNETVDALF